VEQEKNVLAPELGRLFQFAIETSKRRFSVHLEMPGWGVQRLMLFICLFVIIPAHCILKIEINTV